MIATFTGSNKFVLKTELDRFVNEFVTQNGDLALERVDGEEAEFERIREAMTSLPFLVPKKLIVVRSPGSNKQFTEQVEAVLSAIPDTNDIVLLEPKIDKRTQYYKFLKSVTEWHEFGSVDEQSLTEWLQTFAKQHGGTISAADSRYLIQRTGEDQLRLSQEVLKLLDHSTTITRASIEQLVEASPQSTIFELLEAAFAGNAVRTIGLYQEQRALLVEPQQIIGLLAWQLHVIACIKAAGNRTLETIAKEAKISPFVLRKSQPLAQKLPKSVLIALVNRLTEIDVASKKTALDLDDAVQQFLLSITLEFKR